MLDRKKYNSDIPLRSRKFQRILEFYLFNCPVEGTSIRAKTFSEQGWVRGRFQTLKSQMLSCATQELKQRYKPCKSSELEKAFQEMEGYKDTDEFCIFLKHDEKRVMESLYAAIRNAFAHGSFIIKKKSRINMYLLTNYNEKLKAQIQLREDTLLSWIDVFYTDPLTIPKKKEKR